MSATINQNATWFSAYEDSDEFQMTRLNDGSINVEIENSWAGDTETGFGRSCSLKISRETALALGEWLHNNRTETTDINRNERERNATKRGLDYEQHG